MPHQSVISVTIIYYQLCTLVCPIWSLVFDLVIRTLHGIPFKKSKEDQVKKRMNWQKIISMSHYEMKFSV
jgi:hypothetical protein